MCVCVCERVSVCEREREYVCLFLCLCVRESEREGGRERVCVSVCLCVCVREAHGADLHLLHGLQCLRWRDVLFAAVCAYKRKRKVERKGERENVKRIIC